MTWLVTGGAGYIGAHVAHAFLEAEIPVVVLDDLSSGYHAFVPSGVPFAMGSVLDTEFVRGVLRENGVTGVVHVAGYKLSLIHISEPTRLLSISYAVFCLK